MFAKVIDKDISVYESEIDMIADEYIDSLQDPKSIKNSQVFTGLIVSISKKCRFNENIATYESVDFIWSLWEKYRNLVYRCGQYPFVEEFALMLNISRETFYSWAQGKTRSGDRSEKLNLKRSDTCKKMMEECKLARTKGAGEGKIGMIFLSKAIDGLRETEPMTTEEIAQNTIDTLPSLEDLHRNVLESLPVNDTP